MAKESNREEREEREGREEEQSGGTPRVWLPGSRPDSPLSPEGEWAMRQTIGCAIAVHRALGPGFLESIYRKAMCIELENRSLSFERVHRAQVISYLRTTGLKGGLLINFRVRLLKDGIQRIVLSR